MSCKHCGSEFKTALEDKTGVCITCIPEVLLERDVVKDQLTTVRAELYNAEERNRLKSAKIDELTALQAKQASIYNAEMKGRGAGEALFGPDQNPYEKDSDEHACWEYGRYVSSLGGVIERAQAVMLWTIDNLEYVKQISDSEASAKIDTIAAKLAPFLERFVAEGKQG